MGNEQQREEEVSPCEYIVAKQGRRRYEQASSDDGQKPIDRNYAYQPLDKETPRWVVRCSGGDGHNKSANDKEYVHPHMADGGVQSVFKSRELPGMNEDNQSCCQSPEILD